MELTKEWLVEHYVNQGLSIRECAKLIHCARHKIKDKLREFSIQQKRNPIIKKNPDVIVDGDVCRVCTKCGRIAPLGSGFGKDRASFGGYRPYCIECLNEYKRHDSLVRRFREMNLLHQLTPEQWHEANKYFNNRCAYCYGKDDITHDHVVPISKGGHYIKCNIIPACRICNSSKGNRNMEEWYKRQSFFSSYRLERIRNWVYQDGQQVLVSQQIKVL